jgi:hypothetical protein
MLLLSAPFCYFQHHIATLSTILILSAPFCYFQHDITTSTFALTFVAISKEKERETSLSCLTLKEYRVCTQKSQAFFSTHEILLTDF